MKVEIPISKIKLVLFSILAMAFVIAGFFFVMQPENFESPFSKNEQVIRLVGIASVVIFGGCFLWIVKRLFEDKIGLKIDENGITDHSSGVSIGFIDWNDIVGIETYKISSTKFVVLLTDKPDKYIAKASNRFVKKAMQSNHRMCGSPLTINANSLKISAQKLEELIIDKWLEWGRKAANDTNHLK